MMRKLRLNLEQLHVESFAPAGPGEVKRGTVQGHAKATYACTEGWAGCVEVSIDGYSCYWECTPPSELYSCQGCPA